jgi:hypothetical protein
MPTKLHIRPNLATEIETANKLLAEILQLLRNRRDDVRSKTIPEFCRAEKISRGFFYELKKQGRGPRLMQHADGCIRISPEAQRDWRRSEEAATPRKEAKHASLEMSDAQGFASALSARQVPNADHPEASNKRPAPSEDGAGRLK